MPDAFPFEEASVELYVAHLNNCNATLGAVKGALSAIAWHHKSLNKPDPSKSFGTKRMLVSLGREAPAPRRADPITLTTLEACVDLITELGRSGYESKMLKAALLLLYYGCLRVGEVALSTNPDNVLKLACAEFLTFNSVKHFKFTLLKYKHSRAPATRCIAPNPQASHCPVAAFGDYVRARPRGGIHWLVLANGNPVPRLFIAPI